MEPLVPHVVTAKATISVDLKPSLDISTLRVRQI